MPKHTKAKNVALNIPGKDTCVRSMDTDKGKQTTESEKQRTLLFMAKS